MRACETEQNRTDSPQIIRNPMPEAKIVSDSTTNTMGESFTPVESGSALQSRRKADAARALLRFLCLFSSTAAFSFMLTAEQRSSLSVLLFQIPLHAKWSFSDSFEYLVGISAVVAAHSLVQLVLSVAALLKKLPAAKGSRCRAWVVFVGDQILAYAMLSAGSASAGLSNPNRVGIKPPFRLPDFRKPLHHFCDRAALSLSFAFFSFLLLAASALLDVISLSLWRGNGV
ncbi:hypothetical protein ACLOJK_017769 [Asimina triloba]